jgi:sugar phosphate isomerase/epimerase
MIADQSFSRRSLLALTAAMPILSGASKRKQIPVGLELYSVRDQLKEDLIATVRSVAKMGYEDVEFYSPYFDWTAEYARQVRKLLDDVGVRCLSTHNDAHAFNRENLSRAIELNQILGSRFIVMASAGSVHGPDGWKKVAEQLNQAADKLKPLRMRTGFHNHDTEFRVVDGQRPIELLAANTVEEVALQLDVGTCLEAGYDPVAWIEKNPGRIRSMHCKDWSPDPAKGYTVLFGEGIAPWKKIFDAAEKTGGIEFYLMEQEGSAYPAIETAERCLATYRKLQQL